MWGGMGIGSVPGGTGAAVRWRMHQSSENWIAEDILPRLWINPLFSAPPNTISIQVFPARQA